MLKVFYFIYFTILLLSGCTYQYHDSVDLDRVNVDKVNLNVKTFEIKKNNLDNPQSNNELNEKITKKVLKSFEDWSLIKFTINGDQNNSYLNILKVDTNLNEKKLEKKSIISVFEEKKYLYTTMLTFDLIFTNNQGLSKILKVSSSIDVILSDSFSIKKKEKVVAEKINQLMLLIDEKVTRQLNEDAFKEFIIN